MAIVIDAELLLTNAAGSKIETAFRLRSLTNKELVVSTDFLVWLLL